MNRNILYLILMLSCMSWTINAWGNDISGNWTGGSIAEGTYNLTGNVTLTGSTINITSGRTVTINLNGKTLNGNSKQIFIVDKGCTLTINGGGGRIYNGKAQDGGAFYVYSEGKLNINNCTIENNIAEHDGGAIYKAGTDLGLNIGEGTTIRYNQASNHGGGIRAGNLKIIGSATKPVVIQYNEANGTASVGGGIYIVTNKDIATNLELNCTIDYCNILDNYASANGGGIYSGINTTMNNSNILRNRAMSSETADEHKNNGRGGGFYFTEAKFTLNNTKVEENACMWYGGGGQVQSKGELTLNAGCTIDNNISVLKGAAGLHVTGNAKFNMLGGSISGNQAFGGVGGGIHSSYTCVINLKGGKISNNKVWGRGAGIHINTGGDLELNGTEITGNEANVGPNLSYSTVSKTGNVYTWTTPVSADNDTEDTGYGGGILIDSGSCTMNTGSLSGNYAQVGGGGIGLVMINMASKGYFLDVRVAKFILNAGTVSDNESDGDGAGIYLMKNKAQEAWQKLSQEDQNALKAEAPTTVDEILNGVPEIVLAGGALSNNIAQNNGGGAFQDTNTNLIINEGAELSQNQSKKSGGGVYVSNGSAEINGGILQNNSAGENGGALFVNGNVTITEDSQVSLNNNTATESGGGIYMVSGKFEVKGRATIGNNSATNGNGGGIYQGGGTFTVHSNGNINVGTMGSPNSANNGSGGGIYCAGTFTIGGSALVSNNHATNGGGVCVEDGAVTLSPTTTINNNSATKLGGGLYVFNNRNEVVHVSCVGGGSFVNNRAILGGGACIKGNENGRIDLTIASTFEGNVAKNGGAIYMMDGVDMEFGAGLIRANLAEKITNSDVITTAKDATYNDSKKGLVACGETDISGFGGGIFMDKNTILTFSDIENFGLYNNSAACGADDIFARGETTKITLPVTNEMELSGFNVPNQLYWVEDYPDGDENCPSGSEKAMRYDKALANEAWELNILENIVDGVPKPHVLENYYACLTLGYDLVFVDFIKKGLKENDDVTFTFSYKNNQNEYVTYRKVILTGTGDNEDVHKTVALPSGTWKIEESSWGWKYNPPTFHTDADCSNTNELISDNISITRKNNRKIYINNTLRTDISGIKEFEHRKRNLMRP